MTTGARSPRPQIRVTARLGLSILIGLVLVSAAFPVWSAPEDWRAKINRVDTSDAPDVRVFVTFLDDQHRPVNPELIDLVEVSVDRRLVDKDDIEMNIWAEEEGAATDLVIILPRIATLGETALKAIEEALKNLTEAMGPSDRLGLVVYNRSVKLEAPLSLEKPKANEGYTNAPVNGVKAFMFSSIDEAISALETAPEGRKKAILYVGDGTDASTVKVTELNSKLEETVTRARKADIIIQTVGYHPEELDRIDVRTLRLLSRKTRGTYRPATSQRELGTHMESAVGELIGELVLHVDADYQEETVHEFQVRIQAEGSREVETLPYKEQVVDIAINWILWGIVAGCCCILSIVGFLVSVIGLWRWRKRRARLAAEELLADLLDERARKCETCHRTMMNHWEECEFCEQGMEPLGPDELAPTFVYDNDDNKLCNTCGRKAMDEWVACQFCAQGHEPLPEWAEKKRKERMLSGDIDPAELAAEMKAKTQAQQEAADQAAAEAKAAALKKQQLAMQGYKECSTCKQMMPPSWPECLFCAGAA